MQTLSLAKHLPAAGFRVRVVCPDARQISAERCAELPLTEIPHLDLPILGWFVRRLLAQELAKSPPDLIHIQQRFAPPFGTWLCEG